MANIERAAADEWLTLQAALAFDGFMDAAETERVTLWAAEEIERLRQQLSGAVEALRRAHEQLSKHDYKGPKQIARAMLTMEQALDRLGGR